MGKSSRAKPKRLASKLVEIRSRLGLSQNGLARYLGLAGRLSQGKVSEFERGEREPTLLVLLRYARAAGVWMDVLVDDELDLPPQLQGPTKHEGVPRKSSSKEKIKSR